MNETRAYQNRKLETIKISCVKFWHDNQLRDLQLGIEYITIIIIVVCIIIACMFHGLGLE